MVHHLLGSQALWQDRKCSSSVLKKIRHRITKVVKAPKALKVIQLKVFKVHNLAVLCKVMVFLLMNVVVLSSPGGSRRSTLAAVRRGNLDAQWPIESCLWVWCSSIKRKLLHCAETVGFYFLRYNETGDN